MLVIRSGRPLRPTLPWLSAIVRHKLLDHHRGEARTGAGRLVSWEAWHAGEEDGEGGTDPAAPPQDEGPWRERTPAAPAALPAAQRRRPVRSR